ncbi:unnamed protein product [Effrenium voratum]|uniref:Uncharacterized protein n=1 Tax=Effrenium voratum TaxID=2562239 RepID=A0AA36IZZ7_9DINO|nr:unnamed protein product [Effrenium voratum]CAJ1445751.1 unnamed protein product [Effrenium voratum]
MSQEFRSSYADAAPYFNQPEVALALVLCSAVRWPAEGHQLVPGTSLRYWFHGCGGVRIPMLNIDLEGLLPDSLQLLNSPTRGATERGEKWEELVANARGRVPFLEIYPTEDPHLRAVLEPFEVCWSDSVEYPSGQGNEATVMSQ